MIILYIFLTVVLIIFEISLREITLFSSIAGLFLFVNFLYWNKKFKEAISIGFIASVFIDLFLQNDMGRTLFSVFAPLVILSIFDSILQVDNKISRLLFALIATLSSIVLNRVLFILLFFRGQLVFGQILETIIVSGIFSLLLNLILGNFLLKKEVLIGIYNE